MKCFALAMTAFGLIAQTMLHGSDQTVARKSPPSSTLEEQIAIAEKGTVRERIWVYRGFVEDPSGKRMGGVKINIYRSGSGGKTPVASARSDSHGHFLVHLTNGDYTAVMQARGFSPLIYIFEITYEGVEKELRFRLIQATNT